MNRIEFLRSQIERAERFAAMLTNIADRERFQRAADDYQREIDALSAADITSADTSVRMFQAMASPAIQVFLFLRNGRIQKTVLERSPIDGRARFHNVAYER